MKIALPLAAVLAVASLGAASSLVLAGPASAADELLSQGKPVTASSVESADYTPASAAVDGKADTRWASTWSDPQWLQVDLGAGASITRVVLNWEAAAGKAFMLEASADGSTGWSRLYSTTTGAGGVQTVDVAGTGRYVRLTGTARTTGYGYSLWEFQVYGTRTSGPTPSVTPTATPSPTTSPVPSSDPGTPGTIPGNWTPVWSENFDGAANTSPAGSNWQLRTGTQYPGGAAHWGTGSVETASDSTANVKVDGTGKLAITAIRDGAGNWTSGRIETKRDDFAAGPGEQVKFAAVLKQPDVANGLGYWPGFRATGAAYRTAFDNWPTVGETDIMTDVNGRSQLSNTLHCGTAPGGACNEYDGRTSGLATCAGCQTGYHEYAQVIDRTKTDEEVRFYLDGVQTWSVKESQVGVTAWNAALHHGFYLRLDLAIGGSLPDYVAGKDTPTAATTSGGVLSVDSVSVAKVAAGRCRRR